MRKNIACMAVAGVSAAVLGVLGASGAGASDAATRVFQPAGHGVVSGSQAAAVPGAQLWVKRYTGSGNQIDDPAAIAVSPSGGAVFVTGTSAGATSGKDYATVAYNAATGAKLWVKRYNGPVNGNDIAHSVAVSPGGKRVFVTGESAATSVSDYTTVAYNAATGAQLWVKRYDGPAAEDYGQSVAVSPSGSTVFVTGYSYGGILGYDYATVAYNAATGAQLWVKRYNGPAGNDEARSVAVSPSGGTVFVTGYSYGQTTDKDYATVAYNAATGAQVWVKRYNGPGNRWDTASSVAASPGGDRVFVTGISAGATTGDDYATVAYNAATGAQLWVKRYNGPANFNDYAYSVAASPGGSTVFVTGTSSATTSGYDYATVAYNAATGTELWAQRYNGPGNGNDVATSVAASPGGSTVFVTGGSYGGTSGYNYATVAYNAATGTRLWAQPYNGPANGNDEARSIAVSADKVFVTGYSFGTTSSSDYATVAYSG